MNTYSVLVNVTGVRESEWDKDGTIVKVSNVTFDDGSEAPGYDLPPGLEIGKPLPNGWEVATAKSGKKYIKVPKAGGGFGGGGAAAFRNTKEGFLLEQESIHRSVALQQAVALTEKVPDIDDTRIFIGLCDTLYEWLRKTAGVAATPIAGPTSPAPAPSSAATAGRGPGNVPDAKEGSAAPGDQPQPSRDDGADTEQAGVLPAEGGASVCSHPSDKVVLRNPAGKPLPRGFWRCEACGFVGKDA